MDKKMIKNKKLSEIIIEMAKQLLKMPNAVPSSEAAHVALLLASVAWNREVVGDVFQINKEYSHAIKDMEKHNPNLWNELVALDCETMISHLRKYKRRNYRSDAREITSCGTNERGNIQVTWK
jgi:hypothetical protein